MPASAARRRPSTESVAAFTVEPPYRFTGCKRGYYDTQITAYRTGEIGGLLDVNEFDGSGGTNVPYEFHISNAQYRVYKQPLFCEGTAKAHFSRRMLSGDNAFDTFHADVFKAKIVEHPLEQAPRMAQDFTRLNFGW